MNQNVQPPNSNLRSCPLLLMQGLSWIGSLSLLSSGMVLAQGAASELVIPDTAQADSLPAAPALTQPANVQPISSQPTVAPPEPLAPVFATPARQAIEPTIAKPSVSTPIGTDSYDGPTSIVLNERSTGCRAVLRSGQLLDGSPCALDARWSAPKAPIAASGLPSVRVGSFSASTTGLGTSTTPTWQAYYNRTARPPGRLGNGNIRLIFPLAIPAPISSLFGWRVHPLTGEQRFHAGTDLAAPLGTPVLAAYAGKVAIADFLGGYGLAVALDHNKGTQQTIYAHLSEIFVKPGELVKQGMVIGRVGSTGASTGPHLHFEFRQMTPDGWLAMDAGAQLEYALAQLVKAIQVAQASNKPVAKG